MKTNTIFPGFMFIYFTWFITLPSSVVHHSSNAKPVTKDYSGSSNGNENLATIIITCPPSGPTLQCANQVPPPDITLVSALSSCGVATVTHFGDRDCSRF